MRNPSRIGPTLLFGLLALLLGAPIASAQCPTFDTFQAWVDPFDGSDSAGRIDNPSAPFRTINGAIGALFPVANANKHGLVHALPGLYSAASNGEVLPIFMIDFVHVQGAGAKETVIRGVPTDLTVNDFWPLNPTGFRQQRVNLVDWRSTSASEPSLDGFTLQGGDVQVYAETETTDVFGRVSNCVFDMRVGGSQGLMGPSFGILTVSIYFGELTPYRSPHFNVFNNTFIQGWRVSPTVTEVALPQNVAICDVNVVSPDCGFEQCLQDPDQRQRGVASHNIQNNLMRSLPGTLRTAFLGVGLDDTSVAIGTVFGPTNAFDPVTAPSNGISIDPAGTFRSEIVGSTPPVPHPGADLSTFDPGFVGEMITSRRGTTVRDFRLLPDSGLVDLGSAPVFTVNPCVGTLRSNSGHQYIDRPRVSGGSLAWLIGSFDFDGEVHGNPRIVGAGPDIGFDETDLFLVSEGYGNDTKSFNIPWDPRPASLPFIAAGTDVHTMIFPSAGTIRYHYTYTGFGIPQVPTWTFMPGALAIPAAGSWLTPGAIDVPFGPRLQNRTINTVTWVNWNDPTMTQTHTFGELRARRAEPGGATPPPVYYNQQVEFSIDGVLFVLSNLQSEYL